MPWTHKACEGMWGQKAIVHSAKLYHDEYSVAVFKDSPEQEGRIVGWVLTHPDQSVFEQKLAHYDRIEGYNSSDPNAGYYKRDITEAILEREVRAGQKEQIGDPGQSVEVYIYHRS